MPNREWRLKYKAEGRCQHCGCYLPPTRKGMINCIYCLQKKNHTPSKKRNNARRREKYKKEGRCTGCGRLLMEEEAERITCFECHNKNLLTRAINRR